MLKKIALFIMVIAVIFGIWNLSKYFTISIDIIKTESADSMSESAKESETVQDTGLPDEEKSEAEPFGPADYDQKNGTLLTDMEYFKADPWVTVARGGEDAFNNTYFSQIYAGRGSMDVSVKNITYYLGGSYTSMTGSLFIPKEAVRSDSAGMHQWDNAAVTLYVTDNTGKESVAYRKQGYYDMMRPEEIEVDVTGAEFLRIEFSYAYYYDTGAACGLVCLGNPTVY